MEHAAFDRVRDELLAWGLIERTPEGLAWSRRFRGAVMREASRLADEERAGRRAEGAPLLVATTHALARADAQAGEAHARLLYAIELAALPDAVRAIVGSER